MKRALIGAGGLSDEIKAFMGDYNMVCYVDDEYYYPNDRNIHPLSEINFGEYELLVAIGNPKYRKDVVEKLPSNTKFFTFIHPSAIVTSQVEIGSGSFVGPYCMITTNVKIGKHAILNRANQIGHDCSIGDYFSCMPSAIVSGNVELGDKVFLGVNSSVKENIKICDTVTIGANGAVVKSINESGTYVGVPVKKIK